MIRLFQVSIPSSVLVLVIVDTLLLALCFIVPAQWTQDLPVDLFLTDDGGALSIGLVVALLLAGLYLSDLYENIRKQSTMLIMQQLCLILGVELLVQSMLSYLRSPLLLPKWLMLYGGIGIVTVLPLWRRVFTHFVARRLGASTALFVGGTPVVYQIVRELLERPELGMVPSGYVDNCPNEALAALGAPYLGPIDSIEAVVAAKQPERIVIGMLEGRARFPVGSLLDLQFSGLPIERASSLYERIFGRVSTESLRASDVIFSEELNPNRRTVLFQNVYSFILAVIGVVLTLPIMAVIALAVQLSSPGPVLFRQTRVGRNKMLFTLYKFRSMYADAEARTGAIWAAKNDPRITPLGRILRKLRLDELPQFFNVLRGDMAIVGPRPERPEFMDTLENQIPFFRQRLCVKPGITGWAQINHKYGDTLEDTVIKLEYDLYYIKNLTPSLDGYIIFHTVKVILLSRGAQ